MDRDAVPGALSQAGAQRHVADFTAALEYLRGQDCVDGERIAMTTVFGPGADGRGVPRHLPGRVRDQLLRVGYDARALAGWIEAGHGAWRQPLDSLLNRVPTTTAGVMV